MRILRDNAISRYFEKIEPIDRATFLILAALALALGLTISALAAKWREQELSVPAFTAPPFELRTVRA